MRISDWSSDVCSSESLRIYDRRHRGHPGAGRLQLRRRHDRRHGLRARRGRWLRTPRQPRIDPVAAPGQRALGSGAEGADRRSHAGRSEEHTSELQSLMRTSYAVFCLKKKTNTKRITTSQYNETQSTIKE